MIGWLMKIAFIITILICVGVSIVLILNYFLGDRLKLFLILIGIMVLGCIILAIWAMANGTL